MKKKPIRFVAATQIVETQIQRLVSGQPLPRVGDADFEEYVAALVQVGNSVDLRHIGKAIVLELSKHAGQQVVAGRAAPGSPS
ncbi:MAG: hypothetical protein AB7I35_12895 [Ramlibacter sp.]